MKKLLLAIIISLNLFFVYGQVIPFEFEKQTGYKGNNIPDLTYLEDSYSFLVLGDFGRVGDYYQQDVARELGHATIVFDAEFIVSVGDNFYPNGVASVADYHWISSFESVYKDPSLYRDWYVALGNHDYRGNVQAQIDYSNVSRRWNMPARYYSKTFEINGNEKMLLIVMDTNPYIESYHNSPEKYNGLAEQDTAKQTKWLVEQLKTDDPQVKWKIVVGHHPLYSGGKRKDSDDTKLFEKRFADLFDEYRVDAYICGHEHDLQIIKPKGRFTTQFLSGAASEVRETGRREGTIFSAAEPGFMTFSILGSKMLVQTVRADKIGATVLYKYEVTK
ncbi:calcineurin-like phosphoesterase family protein [Sphingobacterium allocomposti]|uniref:acid phosphatase n=2 Tax=Sphingobacterium allocomposti TaxID=415956 RepID=A0A5S5D9V5_9SPHI|nr:calcineurin-like phosphoesterase family protein [Sphingobacterium composti Yoo et al. 2007 non Ten et al. 2007]